MMSKDFRDNKIQEVVDYFEELLHELFDKLINSNNIIREQNEKIINLLKLDD